MAAPYPVRSTGTQAGDVLPGSHESLLDEALRARQDQIDAAPAGAVRIFNGMADGIDGLVIEKFGPVLVVQAHEGRLRLDMARIRELCEHVHARLGTVAVYRKHFAKDRADLPDSADAEHHEAEPWIGRAVEPEQAIVENGLKFIVRPYDGFSVGLFLEHRDNRRRIRDLSSGRRVLNAFAYTCGFSVAAAAGGATAVHSVDLSKRYLEWGKRNFAANDMNLDPHLFFASDLFEFFKRARRQNRRYDLIILDPPTFSRQRRPKRVFALGEQLHSLCREAIDLLETGGLIFLATNDRSLALGRLEKTLMESARQANRWAAIVERPPLPPDFAGDPDYSKSVFLRLDK